MMTNKTENHKKGQSSEDAAVDYLCGLGYEILERNYRFHKQEIDIIAKDHDYFVFVEVKSRKSPRDGYGFQAVDYRKQMTIRKVAEAFLIKQRLSLYGTPCRFDIISMDDGELRHFKNAF
ncbi:MAG: YraN family protein [Lachnospiraceae bacterium]|jgi:putative endonuclease|nr:YraN family protein [Oribacterium sp.]MDY6316858.1 YraN family protein [Oribacterium sp.]MEE3393361.1 YraN family protein [Lachnospiraceae bacterium]